MKRRFMFVISIALIFACTKSHLDLAPLNSEHIPAYPDMNFIVLSDAHLYSSELGTGPSFDEYINSDRKMLLQSIEIMDSAVSYIKSQNPDFVLIPGDMTKDGEKVNHELMQAFLNDIETNGIKVYVIPGNHDINNSDAYAYSGNEKIPVESADEKDFEEYYKEFGYSEAIYRDSISLSYVAEPVPGLWLLALDPCKYYLNKDKKHPVTSGVIRDETVKWIEYVLREADRQGIAVMAMMHHGLVEHFNSQKKHFSEYIVDNNDEITQLLAYYNVKFIFTGHFHANDITEKKMRIKGRDCSIFDIETGSLVTYPSPMRNISVSNNEMNINTVHISALNSMENFAEFSKQYIYDGIKNIASEVIAGYGVKGSDNDELSSRVAELMVAHYAGDEPGMDNPADFSKFGFKAKLVGLFQKDMLIGLNHDLYPADGSVQDIRHFMLKLHK